MCPSPNARTRSENGTKQAHLQGLRRMSCLDRGIAHASVHPAFEWPDELNAGQCEALARIADHSSHRAWADQPVSDALLRVLAACALSAPSKSFLQQADLIRVQRADLREKFNHLIPSMPWIADAPEFWVVCANGRRLRHLFAREGKDFVNEHLDSFFNASIDAGLVLMNFIRAAEEAGLVCCPISVIRDQASLVSSWLALPAHVIPLAGLCMGYPLAKRNLLPRLGLEASVHLDRFDDRHIDQQLAEFDQRWMQAQSISGKLQSAWTKDKQKQYSEAQRADWGAFVREQGFSTD
ncbi:MAG: NADPH-dependent oxidoreductase [Betaproteobacteria bacterium]|nr:NADPH-dependent oxidoreductase [Betaproteobacteria bacterium]